MDRNLSLFFHAILPQLRASLRADESQQSGFVSGSFGFAIDTKQVVLLSAESGREGVLAVMWAP